MWRKIVIIIIIITVKTSSLCCYFVLFTLHSSTSPFRTMYNIQAKKFDYDCKSNEWYRHRHDEHTHTRILFSSFGYCRCCRLPPLFIPILLGNLVFRIYQFVSASVTLCSENTTIAASPPAQQQGTGRVREQKKSVITLANSNQKSPPHTHTHIANPTLVNSVHRRPFVCLLKTVWQCVSQWETTRWEFAIFGWIIKIDMGLFSL